MRFRTLVFAAVAGLLLAVPAVASADCACCDDKSCSMPCCDKAGSKAAASVLVPQELENATPVRQSVIAWFMRPVKIGDRILLGQYVIEHDNARMARGEPCTHIYAASDRRIPVVAFHCTHLKRASTKRATVEVVSTSDPTGLVKLTAFQFAGETAAHGVPTGR